VIIASLNVLQSAGHFNLLDAIPIRKGGLNDSPRLNVWNQ